MVRSAASGFRLLWLVAAIAAVLGLAACGGGGGAEEQSPTPAGETPGPEAADLDAMMLRVEDLPQGFSYEITSDVLTAAGLEEPLQRVAGRHLRSLLEESQQAEGKTVCIVSDLELYESAEAATARLAEEQEAIEQMAAGLPPEQGVPEQLDLPAIGDEIDGFFLSAPRVTFCGWENVQAEVVSLTFREDSLLADIRTYTLGQGASTDQAVELARKLLTRIEAGPSEQ
jgi:hypothetical protein